MSGTDDRNNTFGAFAWFTTEDLEKILSLDADNTGPDELDIDTISSILEVLENREQEHPSGLLVDVDKAWQSFQQNYMPVDTADILLCEEEFAEDEHANRKKPICLRRAIRILLAAAIAATLVTLVATAFGYNVFSMAGDWTQEQFHFQFHSGTPIQDEPVADEMVDPDAAIQPGETPNSSAVVQYEGDSLQELLDKSGVTKLRAPSWIPERYRIFSLTKSDTEQHITFNALYQSTVNKEDTFLIDITEHITDLPLSQYEKDARPVQEYEAGGAMYYIYYNNSSLTAAAVHDQFEICISGDLTEEEIKQMINSIYDIQEEITT